MGKIWYGDVNNIDDFGRAIEGEFIDGRTKHGSQWAIMNPTSFEMYGVGLGEGRGQKYRRSGVDLDGKVIWSKVEG